MKYFVLTILITLTIVFSACDSVESLGLTVSSDDANVSDNSKLKERITELEKQNAALLQQNRELEAQIASLEQEYEELEAQIASLEQEYEEILTVANSERPEPNNSVDLPTSTPTPQSSFYVPKTGTHHDTGHFPGYWREGGTNGFDRMYQGQILNTSGYSQTDIDGCSRPGFPGFFSLTSVINDPRSEVLTDDVFLIGRLIAPVDVGSLEIPVKLTLPEVIMQGRTPWLHWVEVRTQGDLLYARDYSLSHHEWTLIEGKSFQDPYGILPTYQQRYPIRYLSTTLNDNYRMWLCGDKFESSEDHIGKVRSSEDLHLGRYGMSEIDPDNPVKLFFFDTKLTKAYPADTVVVFEHMSHRNFE